MAAHDEAEDHSRLERVVDTCVLAPMGAALQARSALPSLVRRTRGQLATAKVVGRFAVQRGAAAAEGVLSQAQEQAASLLGRGGPAVPDLDLDADPGDGVTTGGPGDAESGDAAEAPFEAPTYVPTGPAPDPSGLAIPDYDSLSASQVVPRLESLSRAELEAIGEYEAATRARRTILAKVAQLESS